MTQAIITLYAYTFRSRAERVIWALNELDLDYRLIRLDLAQPNDKNFQDFIRLNPNRKIPVLLHHDQVYTESMAIVEYLDSLNPNRTLIPVSTADNYRLRHIMHYALSEIEAYLWLGRQAAQLQARYSWPEGTETSALQQVRENLPYLYRFIGDQPFAIGDRFSLADIYLSHLLAWARAYEVQLPQNISDYLDRMERRPAFPKRDPD